MNIIKLGLYNLIRKVRISTKFSGITIEQNVVIKGDVRNIKLGRGVIIQSGCVIHLGGMSWCGGKGHLEIGDNSVISPNCVIYAAGPGGVKIGKNFDCGPGAKIFASRTDYVKGPGNYIFAPVVIGDNVTIFANAVIGPGVKIGNGAAVAAGAVVNDDVPESALVGGVPSKVLRENVKR